MEFKEFHFCPETVRTRTPGYARNALPIGCAESLRARPGVSSMPLLPVQRTRKAKVTTHQAGQHQFAEVIGGGIETRHILRRQEKTPLSQCFEHGRYSLATDGSVGRIAVFGKVRAGCLRWAAAPLQKKQTARIGV